MPRIRSKGLPPVSIPAVDVVSTYRLDLQKIFDQHAAKYYKDAKIKWLVLWGDNMTRTSAFTNFEDRVVKVSKFIHKRLYEKDDS